jgi:hypothetical protein
MTVPYTFANRTGNIPLSELDANFSNVSAFSSTAGTVTTASQPNITHVGTLTSLTVSGSGSMDSLTVGGNVTANNIIGTVVGNVSNAEFATSAATVTTNAQPNITSVGTLSSLTVTANISTNGNLIVVGNVEPGNIVSTGFITGVTIQATGNLVGGNANIVNSVNAVNGNFTNVAATITTAAQPYITSLGTLANLSVTGNVTAGNFIGNVVGDGAGTPTISSTTNLDLSAVSAVRVIGGGTFRLPTLTSAQIANLIAANGDVAYNSTTSTIQGYENSSWVRLSAGPAFMSYVTTGQSLSTTGSITSLALIFDSVERETPANLYNESTGIFQPTTAGYYQVNAGAAIGTTDPSPTYTNVFYSLVIYKNASGVVNGSVQSPIDVGGTYFLPESNASRLIYLNGSTDYVQCYLVYYVGTSVWTTTTNLIPNYFNATWVHD